MTKQKNNIISFAEGNVGFLENLHEMMDQVSESDTFRLFMKDSMILEECVVVEPERRRMEKIQQLVINDVRSFTCHSNDIKTM